MQLATLLVCVFTLLSNNEVATSFAERDEARLLAQAGLRQIQREIARKPNPFLLYYAAREYEAVGNLERAAQNYQAALEMTDLPSAILLLDEVGEETDLSKDIYEKITNIKLDSGALRMPLLSHYFLHRGFLRARQGLDPERSLRLSAELDPLKVSARLALINLYVKRLNPLLYNELIELFRSFSDFSNQYVLLVNAYLLTSVVVTVVLFLYLIGLFIRHSRSVFHGLLSLLPTRIPYHLRLGIVALIILTVALWGLGSPWLWVGLLLVIAFFCSFREKAVLVGGSVLLLMAPVFTSFEQKLLDHGDALLLYRAQVSPYDSALVDSLHTIRGYHPSYPVLFSIGIQQRRIGQFDEAEAFYTEALREHSDSSALHNNLGNILLNIGEIDNSVAEYERAIKLNPDLASAHFNLSQAYLRLMRFDKYTEQIELANKLDFDRITEFLNNSSEHPNRTVIDESLPVKVFWNEVSLTQGKELASPALQLGNSTLVLVGVILAVCLIFMGRTARVTRNHCTVCKAPVCSKCAKIIDEDMVCSSCSSKLKLTKSPGIQQKIAQRIKTRKARLKRLAGAVLSLLPGMGHIYLGSIFKGCLLLLVSTYFITIILNYGVPYQPGAILSGLSDYKWVLTIALVVLMGLAVSDVLRKRIEI
jgi:tetratricopeptide (TPR) repeat protein